jgi:hypothetical protein
MIGSFGTLKDFVSARLAELDRNPFDAARKGKLERSYVNDILIDKKKSIRADMEPKLEDALDLPAGTLASLRRHPNAQSVSPPQQANGFRPRHFSGDSSMRARDMTALNNLRNQELPAELLTQFSFYLVESMRDLRLLVAADDQLQTLAEELVRAFPGRLTVDALLASMAPPQIRRQVEDRIEKKARGIGKEEN